MKVPDKRSAVRSWQPEDAPALAHHANNAKIAQRLRDRFPHPYTLTDAQHFIAQALAREPQTEFAIEVEGQAVGGIGLVLGTDIDRLSAELGYWLGETYWGRGIASDAVRVFVDDAFTRFGLVRIFSLTFADNAASIRVLEKSGFVCEGHLRRSAVKDGHIVDQVLYARVRE